MTVSLPPQTQDILSSAQHNYVICGLKMVLPHGTRYQKVGDVEKKEAYFSRNVDMSVPIWPVCSFGLSLE